MLVLTGLAQQNGMALGDGPGDHARAAASYLTGVHPKKTAGADIQNGVSADQIVAQHIGKATRFASIELGCDDSRTVGNCDSGYSCAYTNSLSWRSENSPMPPETNPRLVFERLFGADAHLDPAARQRRMMHRRSILDVVGARTKELSNSLGANDRRKVDEYLHAVREIERQIQVAESDTRDLRPGIDKPTGIPVAFADYVKLMYDLQVVAFQTDLTRVVTMMVGREGSMRTYPEIGVPDPHHPLTHHRNNKEWMARVEQINVFHAELFAYFIGKLKATPDGDSNLLANSLVVYGSGLSDGNRHTHEDLPVMIVGQGGGLLRTGPPRRLRQADPDEQPVPDAAGRHGRADRVARRQHRQARLPDRRFVISGVTPRAYGLRPTAYGLRPTACDYGLRLRPAPREVVTQAAGCRPQAMLCAVVLRDRAAYFAAKQ